MLRTTRLFLVIAVSGIVFFGPAPSAEANAVVGIVERDPDNASTWGYEPPDVTIPAGASVVWEWKGQDQHSVTSDNGAFDSGVKQGVGQRWEYKFASPGEYPYSCTPHPFMYGTVHVT
ncbi:MAG: cupredoxin domain-containing protein [Acidimicrobiia bacterium]